MTKESCIKKEVDSVLEKFHKKLTPEQKLEHGKFLLKHLLQCDEEFRKLAIEELEKYENKND